MKASSLVLLKKYTNLLFSMLVKLKLEKKKIRHVCCGLNYGCGRCMLRLEDKEMLSLSFFVDGQLKCERVSDNGIKRGFVPKC